jgi:hypothetical protein
MSKKLDKWLLLILLSTIMGILQALKSSMNPKKIW